MSKNLNDLSEVANAIAKRMFEIESNHVTKSLYRELGYYLLWDALIDEFHKIGVDLSGMIEDYQR